MHARYEGNDCVQIPAVPTLETEIAHKIAKQRIVLERQCKPLDLSRIVQNNGIVEQGSADTEPSFADAERDGGPHLECAIELRVSCADRL